MQAAGRDLLDAFHYATISATYTSHTVSGLKPGSEYYGIVGARTSRFGDESLVWSGWSTLVTTSGGACPAQVVSTPTPPSTPTPTPTPTRTLTPTPVPTSVPAHPDDDDIIIREVGSTVVIDWEPTAGATYYEVWRCDAYAEDGCDDAFWWEKLASEITDTIYTDTDPPRSPLPGVIRFIFYYVHACNSIGCSGTLR